ncbi:hypothetical protein AWB69_03576 [Caballeronia udeis]|uniref:Uncharacterized protein n=1 Tax=Caballeronia udeis TaxID=1232866 RepID=A0A158GY99_9BURK|nr:hypothetical protein AWB69_03576 [Caballeronia udeis]
MIQRALALRGCVYTDSQLTPSPAAKSRIVSDPANARTASFLRSLSGSFAAVFADRFMHTLLLKRWSAMVRHQVSPA